MNWRVPSSSWPGDFPLRLALPLAEVMAVFIFVGPDPGKAQRLGLWELAL
jgi:hypothetical protein